VAEPAESAKLSWSSQLLQRLGRTTTSGLYLPEIDGLRTVAILFVVLYHLRTFIEGQNAYPHALTAWEEGFTQILRRGFFGVELFFAVSGFIIALPFASHFLKGGPAVNVGRFYLRRLTRLEPPYLINLVVNAFIRLVVDHAPLLFVVERFFASAFYLHNQIYAQHSVINLAAWSLEIEFQFYFLAPFFLGVFALKPAWLRRGLTVAAMALIIALRPDWWRIDKSLVGKIEYFGVGLLIADIYLTNWQAALPRRRQLDGVAITGWIGLGFLLALPETRWVMLGRPVALFAAVLGSIGGTWFSAVLRYPWIATFGGMCYTVYLYHSLVLAVTVRLAKRLTLSSSYLLTYTLQFIVGFAAIFVVSVILYLLFEKPFMERDWPRRWRERWRQWRTAPQPEPACAD